MDVDCLGRWVVWGCGIQRGRGDGMGWDGEWNIHISCLLHMVRALRDLEREGGRAEGENMDGVS